MKNYCILIACLIIIDSQFVVGKIHNSMSTENNVDHHHKIAAIDQNTKNSDITIFYGLNDSHSRSWAQINKNGIVGIAYFQRFENSYDRGTLIYKTIQPDGSEQLDSLTTGTRLEKSVLLFDAASMPHIFLATSNNHDQSITHFFMNDHDQWQNETICHFYNEGGKFIYEISADTGPDYSFHLLILKTRSNIDSDDFMEAWRNAYLYHLTNATGNWKQELIHRYNMAYTYDMYIKTSNRQDIQVDADGYVHVTFSEQIDGNDNPSRLLYATNRTGKWVIETALNYDYGRRDDAGWFPSLCLDKNGTPSISCMYVNRILTYSAVYCKLFLLRRLGDRNWQTEVIADRDDGYYGRDGRKYTGGLSHLVFDKNNAPHIIFSDIASTHYPSPINQRLHVGNIRSAVHKDGVWKMTTIYRQPLPTGFFNATEMFGMCLLLSEATDSFRVIGQELNVKAENQYSCRFVDLVPRDINELDPSSINQFNLHQNYPNPFNAFTNIRFDLGIPAPVLLKIYNIQGKPVRALSSGQIWDTGAHHISWNGMDDHGKAVSSGEYFYRLETSGFSEIKKMLFLK